MHLTPDDIASRAFTPSVDGYHQGEVRLFLERVSDQLRALQSTAPAIPNVGTAATDREPRLAELERKLGELISDLSVATNRLHGDPTEPMTAGAIASAPAGPSPEQQRAAADLQVERQALNKLRESLATQQQSLGEKQQAFLAKQETFAEQQQAFAVSQQTLAEQQRALTASQQALVEQQRSVRQRETTKAAGPRATSPTPAAPTISAGIIPASLTGPTPSSRPQPEVAAAANQAESLAVFASDFDDQPLFSDSANDLLDGVLDDVMGDITEEGTTP